jgi:drug/metabolite transporter (DMT)-like permease
MTDVTTSRSSLLEGVPRRAVAGISAAIVLWTSNVFFVRKADDILVFTTWRMALAIPVLAVTAAAVRLGPTGSPPVKREPLGRGVQVGILGVGALFGVSALVNFVALNETTLVNVGVIHALQPAVVAALAGRYLGERVDTQLLAWVGIAIGGAVLVAAASGGVGTWSLHGDVLAVLGLALNSLWFLAGRWVRTRTHIDATAYMLAVFGAGAATLIVITAAMGRSFGADSRTLFLAAMTALFGTVGHTLVVWAHRFVPAAVSSLFILSQPVLIAVLAWIAFDEGIRPLHIAGGAVVLLSLGRIVLSTTGDEPPPTPPGDLPDAREDAPSADPA